MDKNEKTSGFVKKIRLTHIIRSNEMIKAKIISVKHGDKIQFNNKMDFCIGTGRMYLALHKEYYDQLKMVQDTVGFKHIRGHGLFCDDMAICQSYDDASGRQVFEYNYTYLDMVMDNYISLGLRPFLELGFMPKKMASGDQTVFYWKGNVTPPKDYNDWTSMIKALLNHLIERYGKDDVITWPIEVWNEPNLNVFWKDADMQEYFRLYEHSVLAVKEVDPAFKIGGPAVCGVSDEMWLRSFLEYVRLKKLPLDFITRHHYTSHVPEEAGHYKYARLHEIEEGFGALETTRDIVDSFDEFRGMDIHITEFSTSYVPDCPVHDTNLNAAYIALLLSRLGDKHASYSYWTFGDIFEEKGVPFTPFHGGFGLVANGLIPKPTFWTFAFFKNMQGDCVHRSDECIIVRLPYGGYRGVLWNLDMGDSGDLLEVLLSLPADGTGYCMVTKTVDEECCNPLKLWHDIGEPASLSAEQKALLKEHAVPLVRSDIITAVNGEIEFKFMLKQNAVVYFDLKKTQIRSDRGYSYERVMKGIEG
jgi:xylan 1,4-beta-xylosidase